ncbi:MULTISPECIES: phosphoenolpyruvate--protein phosphotransferase [unclassified Mesorhizobium]|uniref:phosphoenolpyruvate--protein phosphotransferase n=1 Tax=unclassified Mesorhizobium TaxID=325217 RepID=UPI000FCA9D3E|nr:MULTISPECIES: phosphoenolpyruvate--protein phosphotransferase [unclassified Mesorhizobium]TGP23984.1 phosphoenolpyruvate--protein phosphotransferase [Mesorhizobium sp. M1D.F.Ca.ET.231.01.1.1]TGP35429.1 phosphoenolpyruvate--protein phosphotransferase [Mesorhizobium sp. M1D.F.Ca.ET.234.01.1.1]TGS49452.1 phosphoenolpyruvate--protein phosphotransferase [Mesorhizobium sp. M1D.F.Ca.ET.184.01.1.1]TGS63648.1 phosphoenolpyruvate--protein phosphotransferase [Mesorhizobium sp. M1D.F.Ca.ET.183.01.1.1]
MPAMRIEGIPASPGYAEGPLFDLDRPPAAYRSKANAAEEMTALQAAIGKAVSRLTLLVESTDGDAAGILEFHIAMLEDDALSGPAFVSIGSGEPADVAWRAALDAEIAGYDASDQDYFRARAADLRDIRDQVLRALSDDSDMAAPPGAILCGEDIAPTRFLETEWSSGGGIALKAGSSASHVAMLARSRGVPMVVGLGASADKPAGNALLDAEHGRIVLSPSPAERDAFRQSSASFAARQGKARIFLARPATTKTGTPVRVQVNIAYPSDVDGIDIATCDGVGLMRTEFLFGRTLPDEEAQYLAYRKVLEWAGEKPVTIRTVDAGGDKPVPGFTVEETNPFLGLRGIRLSLARRDVFRVQIRALLRAAVHGNLKVMFPMIATAEEYAQAGALFAEEQTALAARGMAHEIPPLGIMVEVPSVAIAPEAFANVAFFSIGSNDLTQYVMAAARDNTAVASLNSVRHPAVLRLIAAVAAFGREKGIPVSLCGDAGGDPAAIPALLEAGLRDLSVAPAQLAMAKAAIADVLV